MRAFKKGYTLAESLVAMLIVSAVLIASLYIVNNYFNYTYMRNVQTKQVIDNICVIEQAKSEVKTLSDLYAFSDSHNIRIIAVGKGEVILAKNTSGDIQVQNLSDEDFGFSEILKPDNLYRIEIGGSHPNTKLIAILRLEDT
jgi:prepilin-type N-terminal cleavage/methylation domain-containing protein